MQCKGEINQRTRTVRTAFEHKIMIHDAVMANYIMTNNQKDKNQPQLFYPRVLLLIFCFLLLSENRFSFLSAVTVLRLLIINLSIFENQQAILCQ
jgi:hypothetical protein